MGTVNSNNKTTRTKNPSSSSSSEDSGINMDSEDLEEDNIICPDWTELTSTLELFPDSNPIPTSSQQPTQPKFGNLISNLTSQQPPQIKFENLEQKFGNLDTLLSSANTATSNSQQPIPLMSLSNHNKILQPKDLNFRYGNSNSMNSSATNSNNMPLDLDFFGDLNSSFDSLESSNVSDMIPFHEEDPFELVF